MPYDAKRSRRAYNEDLLPYLPTTSLFSRYSAEQAYTDSGKTTLCSTSGSDTCYTLADLSGNGRDLVQATGANRPTWFSNQLNGLPCLRFDGTNDELGLGSLSQAQPLTAYLVLKQISWTNNDDILCFDTTGSGVRIQQQTSSPIIQVVAGTTAVQSDASTPKLSVWGMIQAVFNGATSHIFVDNLADKIGGSGTGTLTEIYLGSGNGQQWANVDVAEVLIYSAAHSAQTGAGLLARKYLNQKYNLGVV